MTSIAATTAWVVGLPLALGFGIASGTGATLIGFDAKVIGVLPRSLPRPSLPEISGDRRDSTDCGKRPFGREDAPCIYGSRALSLTLHCDSCADSGQDLIRAVVIGIIAHLALPKTPQLNR